MAPPLLEFNSGSSATLSLEEVRRLHGKLVLVGSAQDRRNPPTGVRGTIVVHGGDGLMVQIALEFPQMFTVRAHHRTVTLTDEEVGRLLASERNGTFEIVLADRLNPEATAGNE